MPKVSVVIPVYGVEKYIERCARSLFEQTLDDMEFVFVDDCTKDNSMAVLKKVILDYPNRNNQIKIVRHEHNKGLSFARETGVKAAIGDYIGHCDSDDWVEKEMYETLYDYAQKGDYDFVKSGRINSDGTVVLSKEGVYSDDGKLDKKSVIKYLLLQKGWNSIWNTLVRRSIYESSQILYTEDAMLEDYFLTTQLILSSEKIGVVDRCFYYYYQNPTSISRMNNDASIINRSQQAERNINGIINFIHHKYNDLYREEETALMFIPRRILIPIMNNSKNYKSWNIITPGITMRILRSKYISLIDKMWYMSVVLRLRTILK